MEADLRTIERMQEQLDELGIGLGDVFENVPGGLRIFWANGDEVKCVGANRFFCTQSDRDLESCLEEKSIAQIVACVHPDDRPRMAALFSDLIADPGEANGRDEEYRVWNEPRECYVWARTSAVSRARGDGSVVIYTTYRDVTAQHEAAQVLRDTCDKYRITVENARIGIWEYDMHTHTIDEDYSTIQGRCLKQTIGNFPNMMFETHIVLDEDVDALREFYRRVDAGEQVTGDFWFHAADGTDQCNHISYTPVWDETGRLVKSYGISQVITEQKMAERRYRKELERSNEAHEKGLIAKGHANLTKNRMLGYSTKDGYGRMGLSGMRYDRTFADDVLAAVDADDRLKIRSELDRETLIEACEQHDETRGEFGFRYNLEDGTPQWIRIAYSTFQVPGSGDVECFIYVYDETGAVLERQIIANLFRLGQDAIGIISARTGRYRLYGDALPTACLLMAHKGSYEYEVQANVQRFVRVDQRSTLTESSSLSEVTRQLDTRGSCQLVFDMLGPTGVLMRKQARFFYADKERELILASFIDVTLQHAHEQQQLVRIEGALEEARQANRAKTDFLSRVSHDIRTPLNVIYGMTNYAYEDIADPERLASDLEHIQHANAFLLSLINDILDLSKIESGKMELHLEPYAYEEFVENARGIFEPLCADKGLAFSLSEQDDMPVVVVDAVRLN